MCINNDYLLWDQHSLDVGMPMDTSAKSTGATARLAGRIGKLTHGTNLPCLAERTCGSGCKERIKLSYILFVYRLTLQTTKGVAPSELLLGRHPMDLLKPHTDDKVEKKQIEKRVLYDDKARQRSFKVGDNVFVQNYHQGGRWLSEIIQKRTGPVSDEPGLSYPRLIA